MSIYQRIDETRKAQGVTLAHLNELIGGYRGKLTEVKNGKTTLTKNELEKIAVALHVSTDYLLGNTDDPRPVQEMTGEGQEKTPTPADGDGLKWLTPDRYEEFLRELSIADLAQLMSDCAAEMKRKGQEV